MENKEQGNIPMALKDDLLEDAVGGTISGYIDTAVISVAKSESDISSENTSLAMQSTGTTGTATSSEMMDAYLAMVKQQMQETISGTEKTVATGI